MEKNLKQELKEKFMKIYGKEYRLLAIHLNGFSHSVIYDKGTKDSEIMQDEVSGCAPELSWDDKAKKLLGDIAHYPYQNHAKELLYVHPNKR